MCDSHLNSNTLNSIMDQPNYLLYAMSWKLEFLVLLKFLILNTFWQLPQKMVKWIMKNLSLNYNSELLLKLMILSPIKSLERLFGTLIMKLFSSVLMMDIFANMTQKDNLLTDYGLTKEIKLMEWPLVKTSKFWALLPTMDQKLLTLKHLKS